MNEPLKSAPTPRGGSGHRLRDLDEQAFRDTYHCDRFTATVLGNRLRYAVQHMSTGLMFNAFSPIIRDWYDFAITVSGPPDLDYPMPAVSASLVVFIGTMADAVRNAVEEYGPENLKPGDVLICNDPYRVGTHVNDLCFIRPVFAGDRLVAFLNVRAHQLDMGGVVPGGFSGTKTNVYENGLVLGPMLLYANDRPVRQTFSLLFDNTRLAPLLYPDIVTIFRQLQLGERLIQESVTRYGIDAYLGTVRYCVDTGAEAMRDALNKLPDGVYEAEDGIDCDGAGDDEQYVVRAKVTKRGEHVEVDLSGTSRQARTCINAGPLDAKTAVLVAFKLTLDPLSPFTSGAFRDIDMVLPPGTIVSAMPPNGAIMLYWEVTMPLMMALFRAIGKAIGPDAIGGDYGSISGHNAHGVWPDGRPWTNIAVCGGEHGPWGASREADGDSYNVAYMINNMDPPTEAIEQDSPVVVLRKEYVPDSAGIGYNRGGASVVKDTMWLAAAEHYSMPLKLKRPSGTGAYGGGDGSLGAAWFFEPAARVLQSPGHLVPFDASAYAESTPIAGMLDPQTLAPKADGEYFYFARVPIWRTAPGAMSRYLTSGGGGWGEATAREPARVLADVRNGYISLEHARTAYGVAITGDPARDPEGLRLDEAATQQLRNSMTRPAAG